MARDHTRSELLYINAAYRRNMKMKIGFSIKRFEEEQELVLPEAEPLKPVRSLVQVRFEGDGRVLTYYNDRFQLAPGDRVFVSGKLAGKPGTVESVTTKFKINLTNYERVISMAKLEIHGHYERIIDKMVSYDSVAFSANQFRAWCLPPESEEDEIVAGEGYEIILKDLIENGVDSDRDFVAMDDSYFWQFTARTVKEVGL